ncbi:MAG TPA: PAS domain S-box protein [Thermoanaerobaculia bacterium]|nr:PAS domain S-box protein [Thermoanaerobaculia bacterium]
MSKLASPQADPRKAVVETAESFGPLRALLLAPREDSEPLAEALRAGGFDELIAERVDSREALLRVLKPDAWDVAICQDGIASLDGPAALRLIKGACPDLPVIIVSSLFGESIAAAAMKAGADDFIARGFLARLIPAVEREVRAARMRRGWQEAARGLAQTRARSSAFMDNSPAIAWMKEESGRLVYVNRTFEETFGISVPSAVGQLDGDWLSPEAAAQSRLHDETVLTEDRPLEFEETLPTPAGARRWLAFKFPFRDESGKRFVGAVAVDITERKRAEEALRSSEDLYRNLIEHTRALICVHDLDGKIVAVNESAARSLGYERQAHLGSEITSIRDIMAPEARAGFAHYLETIRSRGALDGIMAVQTRTGERRFWEYHNTLRTEGVETPVVGGLAFDITERLRSEEQLREAQKFSEEIVSSAGEGIIVYDRELRYRVWNRFMESLTGLPSARVLGKSPLEFFPHIREEGVWELLERALGGETVVSSDTPYTVPATGRAGWVSTTYSPHRNASGSIIGVIGVIHDITARRQAAEELKRAEETLRESEAFLEKAQEIGRIGSWIFDAGPQGRLVWSRETCRIYGIPDGEFDGRVETFFDHVHPEDREAVLAASRAALDEGKPYNFEHRIVRPDGSIRWVQERADVVRDAKGRALKMVGVVQDLTEGRQLEEQLRQSQKMEAIGRLAGGVAHDFNNMLTAILGYGEVILSQLPPGHPLREDAEEIRKAGERAAALTRQLLAFGRKQILAPRVVDLNRLVANLGNMLRRLIGEDIELLTKLDPELGSVRADPGQIEQIIVNLAVNARDAMPAGGTLTIETQNTVLDEAAATGGFAVRPGPYVMLAVTDTGEGMDEQTRSHIFEPFFTTKEQGKGTGLGLATVYGIVKQSGGYIWAYSEPEQGSAFRIYLPREKGTGESASAAAEARPDQTARGNETVLLVEDEEGVRALARKVLTLQGYRVLEASGPRRALELLAQDSGKIQLLLTDVVMPGMNGRELATQVTQQRPDIRVMLMSGYTDRVEGDSAWPLLQKPFTPEVLARKVREVLDGAVGSR